MAFNKTYLFLKGGVENVVTVPIITDGEHIPMVPSRKMESDLPATQFVNFRPALGQTEFRPG
jgi:hypothetical protein